MRRAVSLLLLVAVLLAQWAQCFRRENGCAICGRPPAPHVHLREMLTIGQPREACCCGKYAGTKKQEQVEVGPGSRGKTSSEVLEQPVSRKGCCEDVLHLPYDTGLALQSANTDGIDAGSGDGLLDSVESRRLFDRFRCSATNAALSATPPTRPFHLLTRPLLI